jgi:hypothetical protein
MPVVQRREAGWCPADKTRGKLLILAELAELSGQRSEFDGDTEVQDQHGLRHLQPALDVNNMSLIGSEICDSVARNLKLNFKDS